jgi:hypothetical protein
MATKKTTKNRKNKKATKAEAAPPVEKSDTAVATSAPPKTRNKKAQEPKAKKTSALDAALRVLQEGASR